VQAHALRKKPSSKDKEGDMLAQLTEVPTTWFENWPLTSARGIRQSCLQWKRLRKQNSISSNSGAKP